MGRPRKEVVIEFPKHKKMGRPPKKFADRHQTSLTISGTIEEIGQLKVNAYSVGKSISRYIIESLLV